MYVGNYDQFRYKNKYYDSGTKFIFNGKCLLNGKEVMLNHQLCEYLYTHKLMRYFKCKENIYSCEWGDFEWKICCIVENEVLQLQQISNKEIYWTDDMVVKTIWYIVVMVLAVIFKYCVMIWIFATVIWYNSVFKIKK